MKHKHADLIHAWADGAKIQYQNFDGSWSDSINPTWEESVTYRIKPDLQKESVRALVNVPNINDTTVMA